MKKYRVRLKAQVNFIKDIKIYAGDKKSAYRIAQCLAGAMLDNCIKVVEKEDNNISHNMSYYDTTKPKEV